MPEPIRKTDSPILFIQKAITNALSSVYTSTMATITTVGTNTVNVKIDTSGIELDDVPIITLQGGGSFLQFPITVGDQCMLIFSRDSSDNWLSGSDNLVYSTNFDVNNSFALVGINNNLNLIDIQTYTNLTVDKMKIQNSTAELITTLSDTTAQLIATVQAIQALTVVVGGVTSTVPVNVTDFTTISSSLNTLKTQIDSFKV
tara:strand:+ start:9066 stop:9671 length:606 start_codon:yes stop_codon:yes gene_type:complete